MTSDKIVEVAEKLYTSEQATNMIVNSAALGVAFGMVFACFVLWLFGKVRFR